ncbi:MAG TPA: HEAT repeat domain-containing protein [Polyangiaceae bacterium]
MKRHGKWWALGLCLTVCAGLAVYYFAGRSPFGAASAYRVAFAEGLYEYTLSYRTKQQGNVFPVPQGSGSAAQATGSVLAGELTLKAKLKLRSYGSGYGPDGQRTLLAVGLEDCSGALQLLGQDVWPAPNTCDAQFRGHALLAELDSRGVIQRVLPDPDAPALVNDTLQTLLAELSATIEPGARSWQARETTPHGEAESGYTMEGGWRDAVLRVQRKRARYHALNISQTLDAVQQRVDATHRIQLASEGHWLELMGNERIRARQGDREVLQVSTEIELRFASRIDSEQKAPDLAKRRPRALADRGIHEQTERQMLTRRAQGLTVEEAARVLAEFGNAGEVPEHSRFLWRITGLLKLHPEQCAKLEPLFLDSAATTKRRALLLDVLADVGHPEAQASLRRLLESEQALRDPNYALLLQRISFLKHPEPESVRWVEARYARGAQQGDWNERHASAYTLGSLAEELAKSGRTSEAGRINATLRQNLSSAASARETAHALNALGATGNADNLGIVLGHATSTHGTVRTAAVFALGRLPSAEAGSALVELVSDPVVGVQARALRALESRRLSNAELQGIAQDIRAGALHRQNVRAIVELGRRHLTNPQGGASSSQAAVALLRAVLDSGAAEAQTRAAIRRLLRTA